MTALTSIELENEEYTVQENSGTLDVCVVIETDAPFLNVSCNFIDDTATIHGI